ncbi:MAG: hypothetical protein OXG84_03000 [Chloroflexi bacterium]|nr:hypothetical protein [Chloroflexota bacterium]
MSTASLLGAPRKLFLFLAVLLTLVIVSGGSFTEAQGQRHASMYVYTYGSGSLSEGSGRAMLYVERIDLRSIGYDVLPYKVCFSGSAIPGTDFYVVKKGSSSPVSISSNCFTDSWSSKWYQGNRYYIHAISDNVPDANEEIVATLSADSGNPWPSGYYLVPHLSSFRFTISGG